MRARFYLLAMLLLPAILHAQRPGSGANPGAPGSATTALNVGIELQVKVTWQNERPLTEAVHLQLTSRSGVPIADTYTDSNSIGTFRAVRPGSYSIRVTGINIIETTMENVTIYRNDGSHLEVVRVSPRDPAQAASPGGIVSAQELNIPEKARKQMDKGTEALDKGDLAAADEWLQKAVASYPKYARAWNNIGVIRVRRNDEAGAMEAWRKALEADDRFAPPSFNIARVYITDRQPAEAESYIRKGLTADPSSVEGMFLLETAFAMQGHWQQTVDEARKIHGNEHKRFVDTHRIAAEALIQLNQYQDALKEYEVYLQENPDSPHAEQVRQTMAKLQAEVK